MKIHALIFLILSFETVFSQIDFTGKCIDFESNKPIISEIKLYNNHSSYKTKTDRNGFFRIDTIEVGKYSLKITPINGYIIVDTNSYISYSGDTLKLQEKRIYCPIIKESMMMRENLNRTYYLLYTSGVILHGDGFPTRRKLFKIIPLPIINSFCTYEVRGGTIEKYSTVIDEQVDISKEYRKGAFWKHVEINSFHKAN